MFRVVAVSVRGDLYLMGNPSVHPINPPGQHDGPIPAGVGTEFATIPHAQRYARSDLAAVSSYCQVRVVDQTGATVMQGWRTGRRWTWAATGPASPGSLTTPHT